MLAYSALISPIIFGSLNIVDICTTPLPSPQFSMPRNTAISVFRKGRTAPNRPRCFSAFAHNSDSSGSASDYKDSSNTKPCVILLKCILNRCRYAPGWSKETRSDIRKNPAEHSGRKATAHPEIPIAQKRTTGDAVRFSPGNVRVLFQYFTADRSTG